MVIFYPFTVFREKGPESLLRHHILTGERFLKTERIRAFIPVYAGVHPIGPAYLQAAETCGKPCKILLKKIGMGEDDS
jgi:hypothetical protein